MELPPELRCPTHRAPLAPDEAGALDEPGALHCPQGCRVPVVAGIPRFVPRENYASSFGLQWNRYRLTQLDSHTRTTISRDRLARCLGGALPDVRGLTVLEAGCGAGRFTEILLAEGARVFAVDLSTAVEANRENCQRWPGYFVCQADIRQVPAAPLAFDLVLCLGVLQHTPDPEATLAALASLVKPGGRLVVDHYSRGPAATPVRRLAWAVHPRTLLRALMLRLPPAVALRAVGALTRLFLPLHRALWSQNPVLSKVRQVVRRVSPVFDYYDRHPELSPALQAEWSFLDTHDGLTDRYKHFRSRAEIERSLAGCGLTDIVSAYGGNGVEARAQRPR